MGDLMRSIGLDRYDINARLRPALFVLLPIFIIALFWLPQARTLAGFIVSLFAACGFLYFMAQATRFQGRAIERKLGDKVGRAHSARMLLNTDGTINPVTKARYHEFIRSQGHLISSSMEEEANPAEAVIRARSVVDWLLEHTRPAAKSSLVFEENISYGFRRNLLGMKPLALAICVLVLFGHCALLWMRPLSSDTLWVGILLAGVIIVFVICWTFLVTSNFVMDASQAYALRLFSQCETINKTASAAVHPPKRRGSSKKKPAEETDDV